MFHSIRLTNLTSFERKSFSSAVQPEIVIARDSGLGSVCHTPSAAMGIRAIMTGMGLTGKAAGRDGAVDHTHRAKRQKQPDRQVVGA